jgi:osmotically-inducible protein OsmY
MKTFPSRFARPRQCALAVALVAGFAGPLAFAQAISSSSVTTGSAQSSSTSASSDSNGVSTTTRQSASSSGPSIQGSTSSSTDTTASGASVDGTAAASDQRLMDEVVSALAADTTLKGANVNVTIDNGNVTLSGTAQDEAQAARAKQVAEGIAGSGRVNSSIDKRG